MIEDIDGCALWRVLLPFSELQRQGYKDIEWDSHKNPLVTYLFHTEWWKKHLGSERFERLNIRAEMIVKIDKDKVKRDIEGWLDILQEI